LNLMEATEEELVEALRSKALKFCVIGLGRIGLPTAAFIANAGFNVVGVDVNEETVRLVNLGSSKFEDEPGLNELLSKVVKAGRLKATLNAAQAINASDVVMVCVPTPVDENRVPDYSAIRSACRTIALNMRKGCIIAIESTVGPGAVESLITPILESGGFKAGVDFGLASCPERADPSRILECLKTVPRVVGGINDKSAKVIATIYREAYGVKVITVSDPKTANAVKLTENIFRDVNIALMNELALLYEKLDIDVIEVIEACKTKWNFMPHYPGPGVGGPCLPANPYYLIQEGLKVGCVPYLVRMAREVNDRMPDHVVGLVMEALNEAGKTLRGSKVAVLGVSYKANVKDLQNSPMKRVIDRLKGLQVSISIYDPFFVNEEVLGVKASKSLEEAVNGADCLLIGVGHPQIKGMKLPDVFNWLKPPPIVVDAVNVLDKDEAVRLGAIYYGVGRRGMP